jgi:hypothetical protein
MQSGEPELHSFIVKIWLDCQDDEDGAEHRSWRGQITHVPGGERRSVSRLEEILEFILRFLPEMSSPSRPSLWASIRAIWRKLH